MKNSKKLFKSSSLTWFFVLMFVELVFANLAHPATPLIIQQRQLPPVTFGLAFASMAFTNFLFSPFWAQTSDRIGRMKVYFIGCSGYALGQLIFSLAPTLLWVVGGRMISGMFVSGVMVMQMTVVIDQSDRQSRAQNLTIHATIATLAGAVGYLIGGFIGDVSITMMFALQVIGLFAIGFITYLTFEGNQGDHSHINRHQLIESMNPFYSFKLAFSSMTPLIWLFLGVVLFSTFGSIAFDQSFNYFIRDQFGFPPSYNGMLKAGFGVLALVVNSTICIWIIRNTKIQWPLMIAMTLASLASLFVLINSQMPIFIATSVVFFIANSVYIVLIQTLVGKQSDVGKSSFVGLFNATRALGMIFGSLLAGVAYGFFAQASFLLAGSMFAIAMLLLLLFIFSQLKHEVST